MEGDTASGNPSPAMPEAAYVHSDEPMEGGDGALVIGNVASEPGANDQPLSSGNITEERGMEVETFGARKDSEGMDMLEQQNTGEALQVSATSGGGVEEGTSRESTPLVVGDSVTEEMVTEERRLMQRASRESSHEGEEVHELSKMVEQQRYMRLQHLLQKSSIYSKFLLQRMESQIEEKKKNEKKLERRKKIIQEEGQQANAEKKADTGSNSQEGVSSQEDNSDDGRVTRSKGKPSSKTQDVKGTGGQKGRGRKRKADSEAYKLSDYMDNQGHLKKRKLESGKAQPASKAKEGQAAKGGKGGKKTRKSVEDEVEEERYFNGELIPANQPKLLTGGVMRSYQLDGMEWIKVLYENGVNGILADEMGLGKTIQCISVIAHMIEMGVKGPFLIAAPLSTVANWVGEFRKFTPTIPVVLYHGTIPERERLRRKMFVRKRKGKPEELQPVVVTSYEICMKDQKFLCNRNWKFLVVDEGHRIKNLNCKLIKALKSYDAANRLLLTGTPLQNNLAELWSLLNFLLPDIFDDLNSFQSWFDFDSAGVDEAREKIIAQEREQNVLSTLHQILTPFLLRRLKMDVEFCLPPKKEVLVYAPLTTAQERYYKSLLDKTILEMVEIERKKQLKELDKKEKEDNDHGMEVESESCSVQGEGGEVKGDGEIPKRSLRRRKSKAGYAQLSDKDFESIMKGEADMEDFIPQETQKKEEKKALVSVTNIKMNNVWMMLRKCCNHPYLLEFPMTPDGQFRVDEEIVNSCGKIMLLDRMLPALIKEGHKTLVFSQFTMMLDILEDYLELRGIRYGRLDGAMAFTERERQMFTFREDPDCHVFLLSTRAGGLGLNLVAADTVIIYDSDWNPQCDLQAMDRCHRIGQTRRVMVYRLVTGNTIDQRIVERAASKRKLEKMVIHKGKFKGYGVENQQLSLDALVDLLNSVDHDKVVTSKDVVISDEALAALLDRGFCSKQPQEQKTESQTSKHSEVFKVLEVRDEKGNVVHNLDTDSESQPTSNTSMQCSTTSVENLDCHSANDTATRNIESSNKQPSPSPSMSTESTDKVTSAESTSITSPESTDCPSTSRVTAEPMDNQTTHHTSSESSSFMCSSITGGASTVNTTPAECANNALPNSDSPLANNIAGECAEDMIPAGCTDSVMPSESTDGTIPTGSLDSMIPPKSIPKGCTDSVMPPESTHTGSTDSVMPPESMHTGSTDSVMPPESMHTGSTDSVMSPESTHTGSTDSVMPPESTHTGSTDSVMPPESTHTGSTDSVMPPESTHTGSTDSVMPPESTHTGSTDSVMPPESTHTGSTDSVMPPESTHTGSTDSVMPPESTHTGSTDSVMPPESTYTGCTDSVMPPESTHTGCTDSVMPPESTHTGSTNSVMPPESTYAGCTDSAMPPESTVTGCTDSVMPPESTHTGCTDSVMPPESTHTGCTDSVMPPESIPVGSKAIGNAIPDEYAGKTGSHQTNAGSELQSVPAGCVNNAEYQSSYDISVPAELANNTAAAGSSQVICY